MNSQQILWELLEMEAPERFYVNGKEHPAFLLFPKWHWASTKRQYSLYLNSVGLIAQFTTKAKALTRLKEIIEQANFPVRVYKMSKHDRKKRRLLFAENKLQRVDMTNARGPCRVFNIDEWAITTPEEEA